MRFKPKNLFWLIFFVTILSLLIDMPRQLPLNFHLGSFSFSQTLYRPRFALGPLALPRDLDLKYGLDLAGGAHLMFVADTAGLSDQDKESALQSLKENIERRVNLFGVTESTVQSSHQADQDRLIVELPGVVNVSEAVNLIGQTASLEFRQEADLPPEATATATLDDLFAIPTGLTGAHLLRSQVEFSPNTGEPQVGLEFNREGAEIFQKITEASIGKRVAIFLDNQLLTAPTVNEVIGDGHAIISGQFDTKIAKAMVAQLNAGALPLSLELIQQRQIGPTLGQDTVQKGMRAGLVGLGLVSLFMILNYGFFGFIASLSLFIYGAITLALYKLIPVTLTFPGIVGFLLSVGMAVDSNILIFERFKEEIRAAQPWAVALEQAFGRAWDSIRDANLAPLITGFILFNPLNWSFLSTSGLVRGFAVTLILGIFISLFTGIVVTRTLLRLFAAKPFKIKVFSKEKTKNI